LLSTDSAENPYLIVAARDCHQTKAQKKSLTFFTTQRYLLAMAFIPSVTAALFTAQVVVVVALVVVLMGTRCGPLR